MSLSSLSTAGTMMLSIYSAPSNTNFIDSLFEIANMHHKNPEVATDVVKLSQVVTDYIEENSSNENFADIILATFDAHKEETEIFSKWVGDYSRAYPGKELQIKGLYEPIHTLLDVATKKVSAATKFLLKQIDLDCAKHAIKIPFPNDILQLILKKHVKNYSPQELKEVKTTSKKFYLISQQHAEKHFKSLKSAGKFSPECAINNAKEKKNLRYIDISDISFTKDQLEELVGYLPNLNTLVAREFILDDGKVKIIVDNLPQLVELVLSSQDYKSYDIKTLGQLKHLKYLNLKDNPINSYDIIPLSSLANLKKLDLRRTSISKIPQEFSKLTSLEDLDLSDDGGESFHCDTLKYLPSLKSLNLSDYPSLYNVKELSALTNLEKLSLDNTEINDLKPINHLHKIEHLSLFYNKINFENIKKITGLSNLKFLNLSENSISQIPEEITKFSALEHLDLSGQHTINRLRGERECRLGIENIKSVSTLEKLEYFDLSRCNLKSIKVESFELPVSLGCLNLAYTEINPKLLEKVSACTNLIELNLSGNRLQVGHIKSIKFLSNLEVLDLSENRLYQIPQEFSSLTSLKDLDLSDQKQNEFNCSQIRQLEALESLSLCYNSINTKSLQSLNALENLEFLDLSQCNLGPLEGQIFKFPKNLKLLDLGLTEIGSEVLAEISLLKNLERLNLSKCKLGNLGLENLQLPVSLKHLALRKNNLESQCLKSLLSLKNLTHLDIRDKTPLNLEALQALSTLNLKALKLSLHHIDEECVKIFETFRNLEELTLVYNTGDNDALRNLMNLPNLKKSKINKRP